MTARREVVITTVDDALERDGQMLVLVGSQVMLLSPVSSEIARVCAGGMTVRDLAAHLLEVFGAPPRGTTLAEQTRVMVGHLADAGIVRVGVRGEM